MSREERIERLLVELEEAKTEAEIKRIKSKLEVLQAHPA